MISKVFQRNDNPHSIRKICPTRNVEGAGETNMHKARKYQYGSCESQMSLSAPCHSRIKVSVVSSLYEALTDYLLHLSSQVECWEGSRPECGFNDLDTSFR